MASSNTNGVNFDLLSWDSVRTYLRETIQIKRTNSNENWLKTLDQQVAQFHSDSSQISSKQAQQYIEWAKSRTKHIKIGSKSIPISVLGSKIAAAELIDVKISCRGSDDKLYDRDQQLRQRLPRGCTLFEYKLKDETETRFDFAIFALRKFSGGLGDDDDRQDDNQAWLRYFLQHPTTASQIISTKKVNGEACHLSCFYLPPNNRPVLVAGSKNVHLCFRTHSDLEIYSDGGTYAYAKPFCLVILDALAQMPDQGQRLINFLALTRYTAVFEILSYHHQHVVNLSYLKEQNHGSQLKFLTFAQVPNDFDVPVTSLCGLAPDFSIEIARCFHLSPTDYDLVENQVQTLNDYLTSIKYRHECEGSVLYFLNENDQVIGLLKKKAIWYVILRAIRERARPMLAEWEKTRRLNLNETLQRTQNRLKAIQKWLRFSDEILHRWQILANQFLTWIAESAKKKQITRSDISDKYPTLWSNFLRQTTNRDDFMIEIREKNTTETDDENVWKNLNEMKIDETTANVEDFNVDDDEDE